MEITNFYYQKTVVKVIEDEEEETVEMEGQDYISEELTLVDGEMKVKISVDVPRKLNRYMKGQIGESLASKVLEHLETWPVAREENGHEFDMRMDTTVGPVKIDAKLSPLHLNGKSYRWQFHLDQYLEDGAAPAPSKTQMSTNTQRKDYTQSCDFIACVGLNRDGSFELFLIPSTSEEAAYVSHIPIPEQWQGTKFEKHWVDVRHLQGKD